MRLPSLLLTSATASLIALTAGANTANASDTDKEQTVVEHTEAGPVEVTVKTDESGETTQVVTIAGEDDDEPIVKVVETTDDDGETTQVVKIVDGEDSVVIVETTEDDDDDDDDEEEIIEEEIIEEHHHEPEIKWFGLQANAVFSPTGASGRVASSDGSLRSNQFKACAGRNSELGCGYIKGLDLKVQFFETSGSWKYPRFIGYFRTGFEQGRVRFTAGDEGFASGQATRLDYTSVPLFMGGNIYLFDEFPVRPYAGLGAGFDILRLDYRRAQEARVVDASARIGFELHAGLEVRISNYIALNAEVMQLWSARRKMSGLPDYSNTGLSVLGGVTVAIPVGLGQRGEKHTTVRKVRRVRRD